MIPHRDRDFRRNPKIGHVRSESPVSVAPESPVTFNRNRRSRCFGNLGHLGPEYADNGPAIRNVCRQFIVLCRQLELFSDAVVAIDGSKFKAVNNRDKNFTSAKMQRRLAAINESIERYLTSMDTVDRAQPEGGGAEEGPTTGED